MRILAYALYPEPMGQGHALFNKGEALEAGERYGFIRFGSRVDLYLPINSKLKVTLGEKVFNGETIIAELKK